MATIVLYSNKINQMPGLIESVKRSVVDYKSQLSDLKRMTLTVNKSVCNLDDVISSISTATQTQETKITALDTFQKNSEQFIADTVRIDGDVASLINKRKNDFYKQYSYLKPESEKSGWDKFCEGVGKWCSEHWKLLATIIIVAAAIALIILCPAAAPLLLLMAKGAILGAVIGGISGGTISMLTGGSFWEGAENGAFGGAIAGLISGGMTFAFTGGVAGVSLTLGQTLRIGAATGAGASLLGDLGDMLFKGKSISFGQLLLNASISAAFGALLSGAFYGIAKGITALKTHFGGSPNPNSGKVEFSPPKNNATPENVAQTRAYVKGCNDALKDGALSPTGRVSTKGQLRIDASNAASAERAAASAAGNPYQGQAGHVPDTTWTGSAQPHSWLDLNPSVNTSLGAQTLRYPLGFQPTTFVYSSPWASVFDAPTAWSAPLVPSISDSVTDW